MTAKELQKLLSELTPARYKASVRMRLKKFGLTQREVCDHIGVNHSRLSLWLADEKDMYLTTINRIESAIRELTKGRKND